ncbi:guanine nucleotide exchange factor [Xylaria arbuscula]|nr:guanine nucleotide exchange factor [Xylaria arbuscula]
MASHTQLARAATLSGPEKLAAVTSLVDKLAEDLNSATLSSQQRDAALEELKIYGRDPRNAGPIFTKEGIEMLTKHAFDSASSTTSRNALRCLCNALVLKSETRQIFVDLGYAAKACEKLKSDSHDDEFLVSRLIFLTTYDTDLKLEQLIDQYGLADSITKHLEHHAKHHNEGKLVIDPMQNMALTETAKLLFTVTHHCKEKASAFSQAIPHVVTILCKGSFQVEKPLDPPVGSLVHTLINLDLGTEDAKSSLFPSDKSTNLSDHLINLLKQSAAVYKEEELDISVTPLLGIIQEIHAQAPQEAQTLIRQRLLPTEDDRNDVLGHSSSLPSWLLKNLTNALAPKLRSTISILLFDLSDKDASKLVENVGYGFASGILFNLNIPMPESGGDASDTDAGGSNRPVNPVTGQFLDLERHADVPEMTDEEKEREAEKLFVLFQRLQANGVISVGNPMRTAVEQGRFEELPDDYQEDVD